MWNIPHVDKTEELQDFLNDEKQVSLLGRNVVCLYRLTVDQSDDTVTLEQGGLR